jgi:hypothetical protein
MRGAMSVIGLDKVFKQILTRFDRWHTEDQRQLADHLKKIVELLNVVKKELKKGKVPTENGSALADLVSLAGRLAEKSEKRDVKMNQIFKVELPKVGELLKEADYFIDKKPRLPGHYAVRPGVTTVDTKRKAIAEACKVIERVAGSLSAYAFSLKNEISKKGS